MNFILNVIDRSVLFMTGYSKRKKWNYKQRLEYVDFSSSKISGHANKQLEKLSHHYEYSINIYRRGQL